MCNRYRMSAREIDLARAFNVPVIEPDMQLPPPELFPKRKGLVVREVDGIRRLEEMLWGFPPPPAARSPVTNVRNLTSPFWRRELATPALRCLVPVSEFCEWEGATGAKVARWFRVLDRELFAFAGLWRRFADGPAYAFLTCDPNPLVAAVHPKAMPVVLHETDYDWWLQGSADEARELAVPFPSQLMAMT